ncbi:hypothetical protein CRE_20811 [Caenorhabditis remanei]|uniref:Uncharacterized protein n=1 Tax=Caenorhabditis remanei TaxID=31234 RepID=E3MUY1_CAERE|nr:hypothetical protein CRE_20811 [Caenorhabditis remanei]
MIYRKHLAYRVSALQCLDDRVITRIKYLKLTPWSVTIDKTSYTYKYGQEEMEAKLIEGDINIEDRRSEFRHRIFEDVIADNNGAEHVVERLVEEAGVFPNGIDLAAFFDRTHVRGVVQYDKHLERRILHCSAAGEETRYVHIHRDGKIQDMLRRQIQKLFGQARIHHVEHLDIGIDYGILRLPKGLVFKVKQLTCLENANSTINSILPIIHNSSLPFHNLSVKLRSKRDSVLNNQALTQTENLTIQMPSALYDSWAQTIIELPNTIIHLENTDIPLNDLAAIAENWIENFKDVGNKLSMVSLNSAEFALEVFEARVQAIRKLLLSRQCQCASRQLTAHSELVVYGYENPNFVEELQDEEGGNPWIIVMEILPIGSSVDLIN